MKKRIDSKIIVVIILGVLLAILLYRYYTDFPFLDLENEEQTESKQIQTTAQKMTITNAVTSTGEINSALEEKIELHATYYLEEVKVEENEFIAEGEKLVEYTNGTYLLAPYDCNIIEISVPEEKAQCTNQHFITIKATNYLTTTLKIDETQIDDIYIGQKSQLQVNALENKIYTGYITNISSTASNGKFTATIEFENDGIIQIGMTGKTSIIIEEAEEVITVPIEAVTTIKNENYVTVIEGENVVQQKVTTGISNDAYIEIKDGLEEGTNIQYSKS